MITTDAQKILFKTFVFLKNPIFSLFPTLFGSYDHLMIVYPVYVFYGQRPFCLVTMETFNFEKTIFLNDNSFKTAEAV